MPALRWSFAVLVLAAPLAAQQPAPPASPATAAAEDLSALKKSCDKGAATDCHRLAMMHLKGTGAPKDVGKAAGLFKKACDLRNAESCLELADIHRTVEGSKDLVKTATLL